MPMAKITGRGLCAIACSVALLWGCLIGERVIRRNAAAERIEVLRQMEKLQRNPHPRPVGAPMPAASRRIPVMAG